MTPWLDRRISAPGPYITLCLTEKEFLEHAKRLNVPNHGPWMKSESCHATTHIWESDGKGTCCIVTMQDWRDRNPIEVAGLLIHEAVHIWQQYADGIGEHEPGAEQEAYAIQCIAQELLSEFSRRITNEKTPHQPKPVG